MQKMVQLPLRIEKSVIDTIDGIVKTNPAYKSRSDYIRKTLQKYVERDQKMKKMLDQTAKEIAMIIVKRGANPGLMTHEEKVKIADEFLKEKGLKY
jgi:metal-responsive CopG/Arc/MetJ family transcriptional regulator